ncbi:MAG: PQQ-like beta-propeller repeat protein [Alphaproteobacteria bacterium]|nr:PQQ-like beta-propeller repeat protein [Alphaproteobacteria bacterium]
MLFGHGRLRQPTTDGVSLYGCDTRGYLYKTNLIDGREDWKRSMEVITGVTGAKCGSTPLVHINGLFVGDKRSGTLYKIDKTNGELLWKVTLDAHAYASITQTPSEYKGVIYVGVNTLEPHILRTEPNYPCCSFRGSVAAIASSSGKVYWRTQLLPDDDRKLSGLAVVNDSPVIDANEGVIYVTTGPVYSASQQTLANCFGATRDASSCGLDQTNVAGNAIVSLNMITGAIKWSVRNTALKPSNYTSLASLYDNKRTMEFLQFVGPQTLLAYDNEGNVLVFDRYKTKLNYVSDVCTQGRLSKEFVSIKKDKGSRIDVKFICDKNSFLQLGTLVLNITITDKKTNDHRLAFKEYQSTTLPIRAMAKSHMISVNDLIVHSAKIDTKSSHVTVNEETSGNTLFSGVIEGDTKGCIYIENKLVCTTDDEIYCYKMK